MPQLYFFIPDPTGETTFKVATDRNVSMSRVPSRGEFVSLGNDTTGVAADYEVILVHHTAKRPNDTDAEVYLRRVDMTAVTKALATKKVTFEVPSTAFPEEPEGA